jgi:FkbM family methyltransferase
LSKAAQNIIINGFGYKAKFITAFIGDKTGDKIKFFTIGSGEAGSMFKGHAVTAAALNSYYMVEQFTIDSLVEQVNYIPDLIKMDIEGAESLALKGAIKTASFFKTKFMIEMHSPPELPMLENATRVLTWCTENHYHAFYLKDGRLLISAETIAQRGRCHLLLLPQSETYPAYLTGISQGSKLPNNIK